MANKDRQQNYTNDNKPQDYYEQEYQRQLDEFNRISGAGGQRVQQIDEGVNDFDDYYDAGYPDDRTQGTAQPYGQGSRSSSDYAGSYRESTPRRQTQSRQTSRPQNRQSKQRGSGKSAKSNKTSAQRRNNDLQFGKNNKSRNGQTNKKGKNKVENKKRHPIKTFFKVLIIILLVVFILANVLIWRYIGMVNKVQRGQRTNTDVSMNSSDVRNILLIGSDTRNADERGRTDSMILLSINSTTKEITMTSFMRDMYVNIKGIDADGNDIDTWSKLNAAYVYGGAELLMDTIEYNFDIAVDDYVYIDFLSFVDIVDAVGGIELDISDEEAEGMKPPMAEQNKLLGNKKGTDYLDKGGKKLHVNGNQALAYARLRYVGNADFQRTERQRTVITKIIEKAKSSDPLTIDKFAKASMSHLATNMSQTQLFALTYKAIFSMNYEIKSMRIPDDDSYSYGTSSDGQSILEVDFEACKALLRKEIYNQ